MRLEERVSQACDAVLKREQVLEGYNTAHYACQTLAAIACAAAAGVTALINPKR